MKKKSKGANLKHLNLPVFEGFPYISTRVVPCLYHIILLPDLYGDETLIEIAQYQATTNNLPTCLALGSSRAVYFDHNGVPQPSEHIPSGGFVATGKLKPPVHLLGTERIFVEEVLEREKSLHAFVESQKRNRYLFGDLRKGGGKATAEELERLAGTQRNGVPTGLLQCGSCGERRGECLDPNPLFKGFIMPVCCRCENNNYCASCGNPLADQKLNANYYSEAENLIWHVPGFCGLSHQCPSQGERRVYGNSCEQ